jgi:hypothetical protein
MSEKKGLLGYCGLYCGDCGGYAGEIAQAASQLQKTLAGWRFELTAKHLFSEQLAGYDHLVEMLEFISTLKCPRVCRERGSGEVSCAIWKCCVDKGFYGCHECEEFETCEKLKTLEGLHGDSCIKNLRGIRQMGLEKWIAEGRRLWFGSEVDGE